MLVGDKDDFSKHKRFNSKNVFEKNELDKNSNVHLCIHVIWSQLYRLEFIFYWISVYSAFSSNFVLFTLAYPKFSYNMSILIISILVSMTFYDEGLMKKW